MPIQICGQSVSARRGKQYTETGRLESHDVASIVSQARPPGLLRLDEQLALGALIRQQLHHVRHDPQPRVVDGLPHAPGKWVIANKHSSVVEWKKLRIWAEGTCS
jgi:hypothetical protein